MCGIAGFVDSPLAAPMTADDATARVSPDVRCHSPPRSGRRGISNRTREWRSACVASASSTWRAATSRLPTKTGTVWIVFNGEVYNFRELRAELEAEGHRFSTSTDTEAIVHAYEQWGTDAIRRLRGMFGLAIWDSRTRTLLLARDRVGIKPLYYSVAGGRLRFGSELKSLLCDPDLPVEIDVDALDHYLSFLYTPRDTSIFRDVCKLAPGHLLTWQDGRLHVQPYWRPAPPNRSAAPNRRLSVNWSASWSMRCRRT